MLRLEYKIGVMDNIDGWVNKIDYVTAKDCPLPGSVAVEGGVASAADILCLSTVLACAFLWAGVDGTTHGRYNYIHSYKYISVDSECLSDRMPVCAKHWSL